MNSNIQLNRIDVCDVCKEVDGEWVRVSGGEIKERIPCLCSLEEQTESCEDSDTIENTDPLYPFQR